MKPQDDACDIARDFLAGRLPLIDACRRIQRPLDDLGLRLDECFAIFVGVDSEADAYPCGDDRQHWNREVLTKKDAEFAEIERFYRPHVEGACRAVLVRFGQHDSTTVDNV